MFRELDKENLKTATKYGKKDDMILAKYILKEADKKAYIFVEDPKKKMMAYLLEMGAYGSYDWKALMHVVSVAPHSMALIDPLDAHEAWAYCDKQIKEDTEYSGLWRHIQSLLDMDGQLVPNIAPANAAMKGEEIHKFLIRTPRAQNAQEAVREFAKQSGLPMYGLASYALARLLEEGKESSEQIRMAIEELRDIAARSYIPQISKERRMHEYLHQAIIVQWFQKTYPEARIFAIPNGGWNTSHARKLQEQGVKRGIPDLCIPCPRNGYAGAYIELKTETGQAYKEQKDWVTYLATQGYYAAICYGWETAKREITKYMTEEGE